MAGRIPQPFIDDLLARVDIVDVVETRVPLKKRGNEYVACCPFHDEKTPSFTVSQTKQFYHCFGCGAHGSAVGFLMQLEHLGFVEAIEELAARVGMEVPREAGQGPDASERAPIYAALEAAGRWFTEQLRRHPTRERAVGYLKRRGVTGEIAATFGLGYAPEGWSGLLDALTAGHAGERFQPETLAAAGLLSGAETGRRYDRFRDRLIFPIRDPRGRVIGFGGRVIDQGEPKYLNSPETPVFHKGRELYGLHEARTRVRSLERLVFVEGYMDVIALAQAGIGESVATLGTAATSEHFTRAWQITPHLVLCFDGDVAGRRAAWRAVETALPLMADGRTLRVLLLPPEHDPDSLVRAEGVDAFRARLDAAAPLSGFVFDHLETEAAEAAGTGTIEARAWLATQAGARIDRLPAGPLADLMRAELAQRTGVTARTSPGAAERPRPRPRASEGPGGRRTLVRQAIEWLLHEPAFADGFDPPDSWRECDLPGIEVLAELLEILRRQPTLSVGALIERFRDRPIGARLADLAGRRPEVTDGAKAEFDGALAGITAQCERQARERAIRAGLAARRPPGDG
ncbi:MAG: DNA primase [Chromatiales bacterium]|nr:DNA primase [Chromatiales bacterium]